ncbi:MAG: cell division protein FtsZ, partial [Bacteroidia bacterium]|nr:cell division protein FtsZ [Bacteroidia bacterium]
VGEDDDLGEAIAVTVIATGFNKEQQLEISNTESKKIIHDLVEEVPGSITSPAEESVVRHSLDIEELDEEDIVPTAENINKIDVVYDEVDADMNDDFVIKPMMAEKEVVEEENEEENQITLTFDLPLTSNKKIDFKGESMTQELAAHIRDIEVIDPVHIKPFQTVDGKIRHGLEDLMDEEIKQQEPEVKAEVEDEELKFNVRVENKADKQDNFKDDEEESPLNLTISQLQNKADDRRRKMKDFNYRFINRVNKNIDEIENQPAYKRMGVDLEDVEPSSEVTENKSRISLSSDDNDDIQLRSNNSYLHDNVD